MKGIPFFIVLLFTSHLVFAGSCPNPAPVTYYPCNRCQSNLPYPNGGVAVSILDFGAIPDDGLSDQCAFEAASDYIQNNSSGPGNVTLNIPKGTYNVGEEELNCGVYLYGKPVIQLRDCKNVTIFAEPGAVLKYFSCLRYGAFDTLTGNKYLPFPPDRNCGLPGFNDWHYAAYPNNCIDLTNCEMITISGLELDGNIDEAVIGGSHAADFAGIQLPFDGIFLNDCRNINLSYLNVHDFGRDGIMINGSVTSENIDLKMDYCSFNRNCRNGFTWGSGKGVNATYCNFNENGQTKLSSSPRAGIDIEWEFGCAPSNGYFTDCNIQHNKTYGVVASQNYWEVNNFTFEECEIYASEDHFDWGERVPSSHVVRGEARDMNFIGGSICGSISRVYSGTSNGINDEVQFTNVIFKPWDNAGNLVTDSNGCMLPFQILENATFDQCYFYRSNNVSFMEIPVSVNVGFYDCHFFDYSNIHWPGTLNSLTAFVQNNYLYTQPFRIWLTNDPAILLPPCFTITDNLFQTLNFPVYTNPSHDTIDLFCHSCSACDSLPFETRVEICSPTNEPLPLGKPSLKNNADNFTIFPNPANNNIHLKALDKISKVEITDLINRVVIQAANTETVDISFLSNGFYFIRINDNYKKMFIKN